MEEKIQKYLDGQLSKEEQLSFEAEINKSDELIAEVEQLRGLEKELNTINVHEFQDKINGWEQDYQSTQSTKTVQWSNSNWYAVAASVVLLVTALSLLTYSINKSKTTLY